MILLSRSHAHRQLLLDYQVVIMALRHEAQRGVSVLTAIVGLRTSASTYNTQYTKHNTQYTIHNTQYNLWYGDEFVVGVTSVVKNPQDDK